MAVKIIRYRSAINGRFVKKEFAQAHKQTTIKHILKKKEEVKKT